MLAGVTPVVVIVLFILCVSSVTSYNLLHGSEMSCSTEGQRVSISPLTEEPCIECICRGGAVVCHKETCPSMGSCPVLLLPVGRSCCSRCKTCSYVGQTYGSEETWMSTQDACLIHTCKGGVITTSRMQCTTSQCVNPRRLPGYCCPVCPVREGLSHLVTTVGPTSTSLDCVTTQCTGGYCQHFRKGCPALDCPAHAHWLPPGECCVQCSKPRTDLVQRGQGSCFFQDKWYKHEQSFRPGPCYLCICRDSTVQCRRFVCKHLDCPPLRLYYRPGVCCPFCRNRDPAECTYMGENHPHGSSWQLDMCTECVCSNGETRCSTKACANSHGCPRGYRMVRVANQCCPQCQQKEASCSIDSNMQIQTFDGLNFRFSATCKYTLAQDCAFGSSNNGFKVVIRNSDEPTRVIRVSVILPGEDRISLLKDKRVKVNGTSVSLPHLKLGSYSIYWDKRRRHVVLRITRVGVKVTWDGNGSVVLSVSPNHKSTLCGICGNYNDDISDDLVTRWGDVARVPYSMAQSFKFGSRKHCISPFDRKYHKKLTFARKKVQRKQRLLNSIFSWALLNDKPIENHDPLSLLANTSHDMQVGCERSSKCDILNSESLEQCRSLVPVTQYYKWCMEDACACGASGHCYCESLQSYVDKCTSVGVSVDSGWNVDAECSNSRCGTPGAVFRWCAVSESCQRTCHSHRRDDCPCVPGCECPLDYVLHGGRCIPHPLCENKPP